jgi:hypothetical protein
MMYKNTPYLSDLQKKLGRKYAKIVAQATENFDSFRNKINATLNEDKDAEERLSEEFRKKLSAAKKFDDKLPNRIQQSSAELLGPEFLPRGETTRILIAALGDNGKRYAIDALVLHCDHNGQWRVQGRDPMNGRIKPINDEVVSYSPDDLSQFNSRASNMVGRLNEAVTGILEDFEKNPIGINAGGGGLGSDLLLDDENESSRLFGSSSQSSSTSASGVKGKLAKAAQKNPKSSSSYGITSQGMDDIVEGPTSRDLRRREVKTRLKKHSTRPRWYKKLSKRVSRQKWRSFLSNYVKRIYNEAKNEHTYEKMWASIKHHANEQGLL